MKQPSLRPADIATGLQVALTPRASLAELAESSAKSIGETHNAIRRLTMARLLMADPRVVAVEPMLQFIKWGVPFAYPAVFGGPAVGVATAMVQANLSGTASDAAETAGLGLTRAEFVWPAADGSATGTALIPLYPAAPRLGVRNRPLAALLSLVDLVRVGGTRERDAAIEALAQMLGPAAP